MGASPEAEVCLKTAIQNIEGLLDALDGLTQDELNRPLLPTANSLVALATHTIGAAEFHVLQSLCGQSVSRDRAQEFRAAGSSVAALRERWADARERMQRAIAALPPEELGRERDLPYLGKVTGLEVLLATVRHSAEHHGQADLTRDLLLAQRGRPVAATHVQNERE